LIIEWRAYSVAAVLNVLRNEPQLQIARLDLSHRHELSNVGDEPKQHRSGKPSQDEGGNQPGIRCHCR
jgi:hypothetical protein